MAETKTKNHLQAYLDKILELLLALDLLKAQMDDSLHLHVLGHQLFFHGTLHILQLPFLPAGHSSVSLLAQHARSVKILCQFKTCKACQHAT